MSTRKPIIRKPKTPKIKKPLISKRKHVKKTTTLSLGRINSTIDAKKSNIRKKTSTKSHIGTCYVEKNCKNILSRRVTKIQCRGQGGKSWKKSGGICELL